MQAIYAAGVPVDSRAGGGKDLGVPARIRAHYDMVGSTFYAGVALLTLRVAGGVVNSYAHSSQPAESFAVTDVPWLTDGLLEIHETVGLAE